MMLWPSALDSSESSFLGRSRSLTHISFFLKTFLHPRRTNNKTTLLFGYFFFSNEFDTWDETTMIAFEERFLHYEKPWMRKKRLKISSVLMRRAQEVNNLVSYIKVKRHFKKQRDK